MPLLATSNFPNERHGRHGSRLRIERAIASLQGSDLGHCAACSCWLRPTVWDSQERCCCGQQATTGSDHSGSGHSPAACACAPPTSKTRGTQAKACCSDNAAAHAARASYAGHDTGAFAATRCQRRTPACTAHTNDTSNTPHALCAVVTRYTATGGRHQTRYSHRLPQANNAHYAAPGPARWHAGRSQGAGRDQGRRRSRRHYSLGSIGISCCRA